VLAPRVPTLMPRHCPRCLVKRRRAVELEPTPPAAPPPSRGRAPIDHEALEDEVRQRLYGDRRMVDRLVEERDPAAGRAVSNPGKATTTRRIER
jgi:hypothetical protein